MTFLANFFSYVFHPLLMVTYACLFILFGIDYSMFYIFTPLKLKLVIIVLVFVFTFLIPLLNLLILYKLNYITSFKIQERRERTLPLLATALCYVSLFYLLFDFAIWPSIKLFILGGALSISITAIINYWWQISAHMIGIGGFLGIIIALCVYMQLPILLPISGVVLASGFVGFSRLHLNAHSAAQVYVGFTIGLTLQFLLFYIAHHINIF